MLENRENTHYFVKDCAALAFGLSSCHFKKIVLVLLTILFLKLVTFSMDFQFLTCITFLNALNALMHLCASTV